VKKLLLTFLLLPLFSSAQIVNIPDPVFKSILVNDTSINTNLDAEIQVSEAIVVDSINIQASSISDLTGIEEFTALTYLNCSFLSLTTLKIASLPNLTDLYIDGNDFSPPAISKIKASISNLTALNALSISSIYALNSLDVTNNTSLTYLNCSYNQNLINLDIRNGNNVNMTLYADSTNLKCISVDDTAWATANWLVIPSPVFSNDCTIGIADNEFNQLSITISNNTITIDGQDCCRAALAIIYNLQGQVIQSAILPASIEVNGSGIYLVRVESEDCCGATPFTKKVYLNK